LTLQKMARKLGVSPMTLQRIETGKSSPSLVLLSEIANTLNKSIYSFIKETKSRKLPIWIKRRDQISMSTPIMNFEVIGPNSIFHNARIEHSITATEKFKFFSIYIKDKE